MNAIEESWRSQLYAHLLDYARDIILFMNEELVIIEANAMALNCYGYSREELIGLPLAVLRDFSAQETMADQMQMARGEGTFYETQHRRKDGSTFPAEFSSREIEVNGQPVIFCIGRDISSRLESLNEQRQTERSILEDRERLKVTIASIGEGTIVIDPAYRILTMNPIALDIIGVAGLPPSDADIRTLLPLVDETVFEDTSTVYRRLLTDDKVRLDNLFLQAADGSRKLISVNASPVRGSDGSLIGHVILLSDITEIKRQEAHMVLAQKLESIGQLAAGIAHEINTPMQYIGDNIKFIKDSFRDLKEILAAYRQCLEPLREEPGYAGIMGQIKELETRLDLDFILYESEEALNQSSEGVAIVNQLVRAMREFSHTGSDDKGWHDLNQAIESTIKISRNQWKYWASMETAYDPGLPMIHCTINQVNQVILNMIVNSAQAIEEMIKMGRYAHGSISICTARDGPWARIMVEDNGGGIPQRIQERIFDPFFTTKDVGQGTGQGLAIAHDIIVNKHGGRIEVESKPGEGSRFVIMLPLEASER